MKIIKNLIDKTRRAISSMPYISKAIIFGGILISTILFGAAFIVECKGGSDWIEIQNALRTKQIIGEYYLLCVIESLGIGLFAHYLLHKRNI